MVDRLIRFDFFLFKKKTNHKFYEIIYLNVLKQLVSAVPLALECGIHMYILTAVPNADDAILTKTFVIRKVV
jgi:hypothetical protein